MSFKLHLYHYDELGSTNDEAKKLAQIGAPEGSAVIAETQNAGRGRRGRQWASPAGNFYFSLLLYPKRNALESASLGFLAQMALGDLLAKLLPGGHLIQHKWPNDLLLNGKKVAGLLLEASVQDKGLEWLIIGIGMNLRHHPKEALYPATDLWNEAGLLLAPEETAQDFAKLFAPLYRIWQQSGFAPHRKAWLRRAAFKGEKIKVNFDHETLEGFFKDIDEQGFLLLELKDRMQRRISAADIFPMGANHATRH